MAFEAGSRKAPKDPRFLVELAGISYKQKDFLTAKKRLRGALELDPKDSYSREFLATVYFLEGNLEAALKYWNPEEKPRLRGVAFAPALQLKESLRNRAVALNAPQVLTTDALLSIEARLDNLGIFSNRRIELTPAESGNYDLTLHLAEKNGWGDSKVEGIVALFGGLPYATIYPEFYNLGRDAVNLTSLLRWDSEKRRLSLTLSLPLYGDPRFRLRLYADARNENWNLAQTFFGAGPPVTDLNMRRAAAGVEAGGVGAPARRLPAGIFEISMASPCLPSGRSLQTRSLFQDGWASSEICCGCRRGASRSIHRPKQRLAGSLPMDLGRFRPSAARFARIGSREPKVTTMKSKRRSARAQPLAKPPSMKCSNWASNATTTSGFAATPAPATAARAPHHSAGGFFLPTGRWTRISTKTVSSP